MALGRGITLTPGQIDQHVLNWTWPQASASGQIDPYCEDQESKAIGISLDRDIGPPVFTGTDSTETAFWTVRWSAGNLTQVAELDIQSGTFMTVFGQMVSVSASYPLNDPSRTQPNMAIRAVLGFDGGRQSPGLTSVARRTVYVAESLPELNSSNILPIPRFAVAATMRNCTTKSVDMTFEQWTDNAANTPVDHVCSCPIGKLNRDSVPIANGARFFSLLNSSGFAASRVSVVFHLGL